MAVTMNSATKQIDSFEELAVKIVELNPWRDVGVIPWLVSSKEREGIMDDKLEELWEAPPDHGQPAGNQYRLLPSDYGKWNLEENRWQDKKWLGW
jgi:hypothetical protein